MIGMPLTIGLDNLSLGKIGKVEKLGISGSLRQRLYDIGFTPGASVMPLYNSPHDGLKAFLIRGTVIALRDEDSTKIEISCII